MCYVTLRSWSGCTDSADDSGDRVTALVTAPSVTGEARHDGAVGTGDSGDRGLAVFVVCARTHTLFLFLIFSHTPNKAVIAVISAHNPHHAGIYW